eukprot:PhM_4_TR17888/c0_g1_i2/m.58341
MVFLPGGDSMADMRQLDNFKLKSPSMPKWMHKKTMKSKWDKLYPAPPPPRLEATGTMEVGYAALFPALNEADYKLVKFKEVTPNSTNQVTGTIAVVGRGFEGASQAATLTSSSSSGRP